MEYIAYGVDYEKADIYGGGTEGEKGKHGAEPRGDEKENSLFAPGAQTENEKCGGAY